MDKNDVEKGQYTCFIYEEFNQMREMIQANYKDSRERSLALTKLEECYLWLFRCKMK